jgi:peroxin-1
MIDPALLRPGRLDRSLFVDLPTFEEILEIMKCVVKSMRCGQVDFEGLARRLKGFTGADINSLFANAQLLAIQESIADVTPTVSTSHSKTIPINVINGNITQSELDSISQRVIL